MLSWVAGISLLVNATMGAAGTTGETDADWRYVRPHSELPDAVLSSVTVPAPNRGWAAGSRGAAPLLLSWNGKRWAQTSVPLPADTILEGLDAASASNVWLVGYGPDGVPRLARRTAGRWTRVELPMPGPSFPRDLDSLPTGQAWIVGSSSGFAGNTATIWQGDGETWQTVPHSVRAGGNSELTAVSARTPTDAWAVGTRGFDPVEQLLLHWNGLTWTQTKPPALPAESTLADVIATRSGEAWAVGVTKGAGGGDIPLAQRWNGETWSTVSPPVAHGRFYAVTDDGSSGIWAAGEGADQRPLLARYDGTAWEVFTVPTPDDRPAVIRALTSPPHLWAGGSYHHGTDHALTWTNTPRPADQPGRYEVDSLAGASSSAGSR